MRWTTVSMCRCVGVASVEALVARIDAQFGRINVLINNAAMFASLQKREFYDIPLAEWDRVMQVNNTGSYLCARAVVPVMRKAG